MPGGSRRGNSFEISVAPTAPDPPRFRDPVSKEGKVILLNDPAALAWPWLPMRKARKTCQRLGMTWEN